MKKTVRTVEISFEKSEKMTVNRRQTLREEKDDSPEDEAQEGLAKTQGEIELCGKDSPS